MLAMQSLADPEAAMGREGAQRVLDNLNTRVWFRLTDDRTAKLATEGLGFTSVEFEEAGHSISFGGVGGLVGNLRRGRQRRGAAALLPGTEDRHDGAARRPGRHHRLLQAQGCLTPDRQDRGDPARLTTRILKTDDVLRLSPVSTYPASVWSTFLAVSFDNLPPFEDQAGSRDAELGPLNQLGLLYLAGYNGPMIEIPVD